MSNEPGATEVAVRIAEVLEWLGVPYAIGGALALGVHGVPRMTFDVDLNVDLGVAAFFLGDEPGSVLAETGLTFDAPLPEIRRRAENDGFVRGRVDDVVVDVFFPSVRYLQDAMTRRVQVPLRGRRVSVVGLNDLVVMKLVFGRLKDFADIETLARHGRHPIDRDFVERHLVEILHPDDAASRMAALDACIQGAGMGATLTGSPRDRDGEP